MRLSTEQLTFLARFAKSPDGREMLNLLTAKLADREKGLRTQVGEEIYRQQGRALELDELVLDLTEATNRLYRAQSALSQAPRQVLR